MKLIPKNDCIFVRPISETVSAGGILLAGLDPRWKMDLPHREGEVVAVGPGKRDYKRGGRRGTMWDLAPGDRIAFSPNGTLTQRVNGEELVVIRRDSVIGLMEEERAAA